MYYMLHTLYTIVCSLIILNLLQYSICTVVDFHTLSTSYQVYAQSSLVPRLLGRGTSGEMKRLVFVCGPSLKFSRFP